MANYHNMTFTIMKCLIFFLCCLQDQIFETQTY